MKNLLKISFLKIPFGFFLIFQLFSCSSQYKHSINFNPKEPLVVAVLPFAEVDKNGQIVDKDYTLLVDGIPLISDELLKSPSALIHGLVQQELSKTGLDIVPTRVVEAKLSHSGFSDKKGFHLQKILETDKKELCKLLSCDALVIGKITKWERDYYAVQTVNTVGVDLKIILAETGKELFTSAAEDYESRGLTKGPTGFVSAGFEPLKGLDSGIIINLSRNLVKKMVEPLHVSNRKDFLDTPPPAILASSHNLRYGTLNKRNSLLVVMLGFPDSKASFSIGNMIENIPMVEKEKGHYVGEYLPLETDKFQKQLVSVRIEDKFGRVAIQQITYPEITLE